MSTKKMLIDARYPEETRVAVLDGNRLEDIDVEVASRKPLKGNIYLAKVTRVEPSLQAAFVDYGGNRHGFLAFNEIHPDYYQIPVADREALVAEQDAADRAEEVAAVEAEDAENGEDAAIQTVGGDEAEEEVAARRPRAPRRQYKIQEVVKRRQILLVQVVKEERGTKGAAMTTYLSLAGRYCVLMPNTARGGGISRKIPPGADRKRLRSILSDLNIPDGMGVIVRTAGAERSKAEIRRDYEYLLRQWEEIRQTTLDSIAPALVYEEASLIKRAIRDLYTREIGEIIVEGEDAYKAARNLMRMLIPSHVRRVKRHEDESQPLFHRHPVENQLDAMHSPIVRLRSGGYIVINPTEALVSIDVNSGRSTRERNIEETALKTNLEACDEVARQLRLRDLAGLVVIDFIDMEVARNRGQVERRLKEGVKGDRARIQLGRITPFGLLEMSRQRLRPSLIETSFEICPFCRGAGVRRSLESTAVHLIRAIEEEGIRGRSAEVTFFVPGEIALFLLNHKRATLAALEARHNFKVVIAHDDTLIPPDFHVERAHSRDTEDGETVHRTEAPEIARADDETEEEPGRRRRRRGRRRKQPEEAETMHAEPHPEEEADEETFAAPSPTAKDGQDDAPAKPAKRRRRGKRGGRRRRAAAEARETGTTMNEAARTAEDDTPSEEIAPVAVQTAETAPEPEPEPAPEPMPEPEPEPEPASETAAEKAEAPKPKAARKPRTRRGKNGKDKDTDETAAKDKDEAPRRRPRRSPRKAKAAPEETVDGDETPAVEPAPQSVKPAAVSAPDTKTQIIDVDSEEARKTASPRRGWWQR